MQFFGKMMQGYPLINSMNKGVEVDFSERKILVFKIIDIYNLRLKKRAEKKGFISF